MSESGSREMETMSADMDDAVAAERERIAALADQAAGEALAQSADYYSPPDAVKAHQAECGRCKYLTLASDPRDWCPDGSRLLSTGCAF